MKKIKLKKRKNRLRYKRKLVLTSTLVLFLVIGIGYSALSVNLNILGNITVKKHYGNTLYEVLEKEANVGSLAREYTGEHNDSFTEEPSKKIYHWYAQNDDEGNQIKNKNNVIFADHCWQMIRTTDTGGVKMIYNGEVEDGKCLDTRGNHIGYSSQTTKSLSTSYYYGTHYLYDKVNDQFSLEGDVVTGEIKTGQYTCMQNTEDGTCSVLYLVNNLNNGTTYNVIPISNNSNYSQFGTLQFNPDYKSPAYLGYQYGDVYTYDIFDMAIYEKYEISNIVFTFTSFSQTNKYSKTISYDGTRYYLDNPVLGSEIENNDYSGYYTFRSNTATSGLEPYYIVGKNSSTNFFYVRLSNGEQLSDYNMIIGDSLTDNNNGSYTINNTTLISVDDWYSNYNGFGGKYICSDMSLTTCNDPRYIMSASRMGYYYIDYNDKIMLGKGRNGLNLTDTLLVRKVDLSKNPNDYTDYKYTCNNESSTCSEDNLRLLIRYYTTYYYYAPNRYFGSSVSWDGSKYTLINPIDVTNYNNLDNISTHHYTCLDPGKKECNNVAYIYYYNGISSNTYYISLKNGVTSGPNALKKMLEDNTHDSVIKTGIDAWYKEYLLDYDTYVEDAIFCNNRKIISVAGWDDNGGITNSNLFFKDFSNNINLYCYNKADQFSISNTKAELTYKVGLISSEDNALLNNRNVGKTGKNYWAMTAEMFTSIVSEDDGGTAVRYVTSNGSNGSSYTNSSFGVRPSISLNPGTKYDLGDGSMENPYIVNVSD